MSDLWHITTLAGDYVIQDSTLDGALERFVAWCKREQTSLPVTGIMQVPGIFLGRGAEL